MANIGVWYHPQPPGQSAMLARTICKSMAREKQDADQARQITTLFRVLATNPTRVVVAEFEMGRYPYRAADRTRRFLFLRDPVLT